MQVLYGYIEILGYVIRPSRLERASNIPDAIWDSEPHWAVAERNWFLGSCNFYRLSLLKFARSASPLNTKLKNGELKQLDNFSTKEMEGLLKFQQNLRAASGHSLLFSKGYSNLYMEACKKHSGCGLMHNQTEGSDKPLKYWSWMPNVEEQKYNPTHSTFLATVFAKHILRF